MAFGSSRRRGAQTPEYYKDMDGTTLLRDASFLADLRDYYAKRGVYIDDDRDLVERFHRDQTFMNMNTLGAVGGLLSAKSASKENRAQQKRLREAYQKLPMFFEQGGIGAAGVGNIAGSMALDPLNFVGFGAGAGAAAGAKASAAGLRGAQAMRAGAKAGAVRGAIAEGAVGAGIEAGMSTIQQNIDLELGLQDNFSMGQLAFDAAAGGVMGGALGSAFGAAGGAYTAVKKHRPARIAAMKNLGFEDDAIRNMSDDEITQRLLDGGRNPDEIDKAGAAMDAATQPPAPAVGEGAEQPTATFGGVGGSRNPGLDADRSAYVSDAGTGQMGGLDPYTVRGPYNIIADVPDDISGLPDEALEEADEAVQKAATSVEADKAADPKYAPTDEEEEIARKAAAIEAEKARRAEAKKAAEDDPLSGSIFAGDQTKSIEDKIASASDEDLQGEVARVTNAINTSEEGSTQRAVLTEFQAKIEAELAKRGIDPTAPEAQPSAPTQEGAKAAKAPAQPRPLKVAAEAQKLAEKYEIDTDLVFADVERKKGRANDVTVDMVRQAYYARLREQAKADPKMVEAEGATFKVINDIETAGGDPTDLAAFEREIDVAIQDPDARRFALELYKASLTYARQTGEVPAAFVVPKEPNAVQKRQINLAKKRYYQQNPEATDAEAQAYAERSTFGPTMATKQDDTPSGVGTNKSGSATGRAMDAAEREANAGLTFAVLTDKRTGEKIYSPRISKLFRAGFSVGDGRTVSSKSMVPDRKQFPAQEAMYVAQRNRAEGKSPLVPFVAGRNMVVEGGRELKKGEQGFAYADGSEVGRFFATREDYEQFVHRTGGKLVSDVTKAIEPIKAQYANQELTAGEAAALIQQLDRDAMAGAFNSLESLPRTKNGRVAAIRAIPADGHKLPEQNVRILSEDQINGEAGVRGLIAQNGTYYGNPANWELAYIVRPPKGAKPKEVQGRGKVSARELAFEEAEQSAVNLETASTTLGSGFDGTANGGAPDFEALKHERPNLTEQQVNTLREIDGVLMHLDDTYFVGLDVDTSIPTYGEIHLAIDMLHSLPWAPDLGTHRAIGKLMIEANELLAGLFPRGVRMPEVHRSGSLAALENTWGQLAGDERRMVQALFERMSSGGAPLIFGGDAGTSPMHITSTHNIVSRLQFPPHEKMRIDDERRFAPFTVAHEMMHWLYKHGMTAKERAEFWRIMEKFYGEDGNLDMEKVAKFAPGEIVTNSKGEREWSGFSNALESAQEYFANQGAAFFLRGSTDPETQTFWKKIFQRMVNVIQFVFGDKSRVDDDLKPLFSRLLGDDDGIRYQLTRNSKPRTELGVEIHRRFNQLNGIERRLTRALRNADEAGINSAADELFEYVRSVSVGQKEASRMAKGEKVRTSGVFSPLKDRATYNTVRVMRDQLYNVLRQEVDANELVENVDWAEISGFQIIDPDMASDRIMELWLDPDVGLKRAVSIIKSRYAEDYAMSEKKTLNGGYKQEGRSFLSKDAKAELRNQRKRVEAREKRLRATMERLENGDFTYEGLIEGFDPSSGKFDDVLIGNRRVSVTQSPYELMQIAFREGDTPTGRKVAALAARRIRATELDLPEVEPASVDLDELIAVEEMSVEDLSRFAMDLMMDEPEEATSFTDGMLIVVMQRLKRLFAEDYFLPTSGFEYDDATLGLVDNSIYQELGSSRPVITELQRAMDMRGPGAESMRTMFSRLINMRGKAGVQPGKANTILESDAATILGNADLGSGEPLLSTSAAFRELRSALRGATARLLKGDDGAMTDLAGMAVRAGMSEEKIGLIRQLGENVGETVAKRIRGERLGLSEYPNRTEIGDALSEAVERTAYVVNGLISDKEMAKRNFRVTLFGDMEGGINAKPFSRHFPAKGNVPSSVAADVAEETLEAGGDALARGIATFTRGTYGEGQLFYAGASRGVENHTGGNFTAGPVGSAIYVSAKPNIVQSKPKGKAKNAELAKELGEIHSLIEEDLPPTNLNADNEGPEAAVARAERSRLLKNMAVNRAAQVENGIEPSGVTPVVIAARSVANLTPNMVYQSDSGLVTGIYDYLVRTKPQLAQVFSAKVMNRRNVTGAKLLEVLSNTIGEGRIGPMLKSMGYDGARINRGNGEQVAMYRAEQVSSISNPTLTTPDLSPPTDSQPRVYDAVGDMMLGMVEGNNPDPARIELRNELRVSEGMDPDLSQLIAEMEHGANGDLNPKKTVGIVRTYNRFMRGIADRMDYLGHKKIAERFRKFEFDQRREMGTYIAPLMEAINGVTGEKNILARTWDYLNTSRRGRGRHRLAHNQSAIEDKLLRALRMGTESEAFAQLNEAERKVYAQIRATYRELHERMRDAGIPIGDLGPDYFGQVWDQDHIRRNEAGFRAVLERLYDAERGDSVPNSDKALAAYTAEKKMFAQKVINSIIGDESNGILPSEDFDGGAVINNIEHSRVLHFAKYPELHEQAMQYMDGSLLGNIVRYTDQATRKINHTNHFGLNGHAAFDYAKVAQEGEQGVVALLTSNKVFTKSSVGIGSDGAERAEVRYTVRAPFANAQMRPLANQIAAEIVQLVNSGDAAGARAKLMQYEPRSDMEVVQRGYERRVDAIIEALQDHRGDAKGFAQQDLDALGSNLMYAVRRGQGSNKFANDLGRQARRFNNVTLLGFTTLTSLSDLAMPLLRTGDFKAFFRGWGAFMKSMRNEGAETKRALRRIGVGMDGIIASRLTEMTGDGIDVVQDMYFRGIGLTGWTNMNSEVSALIGLESFKAEWVKANQAYAEGVELAQQSPKFKKAFRYLAHFGLDFRATEEFDLSDNRVANAVSQFVSETIFAPTPTQLPAWTNQGPWYKTVAQLKSFPLMYERLVTNLIVNNGKGIAEAIKAGDIKTAAEYLGPAGVFVLAPMLGIGSNSIKDIVMGRGGENDDEFGKIATRRLSEEPMFKGLLEDQEAFDAFLGHYLAGLFTSGGLGLLAQMSYDAGAQLDNGAYGYQRVASLVLGPTFGIGNDAFNVASGIAAIPDPEGQSRRRRAVRSVTARVPIAGQVRPVREGVVSAIAGDVEEKQSDSYGVSSYGSKVSGYGRSDYGNS